MRPDAGDLKRHVKCSGTARARDRITTTHPFGKRLLKASYEGTDGGHVAAIDALVEVGALVALEYRDA